MSGCSGVFVPAERGHGAHLTLLVPLVYYGYIALIAFDKPFKKILKDAAK